MAQGVPVKRRSIGRLRRHEDNYLDLNNLPDDFTKDGNKQALEEGSSSGQRKKKGSKEGKDESGKVYECRFCSLKFCKSQALGGHMNRHRQGMETETLNQARQLVYRNDTLAPPGITPFGYTCVGAPIAQTGYPSRGSPNIRPPPLDPQQSRDADGSRQRLDHTLGVTH
ncbi:hypothetical protein Bca52824_024385 [Brassica carinata]|uniref:C2H2-type domain-containing protein n=1 Tax=Brassica carinata TaxID=52824 RepID=A0A8X7VJI7_BRACI|nr:hypothetical protein Bca52824_024385 [Brassica carinata]